MDLKINGKILVSRLQNSDKVIKPRVMRFLRNQAIDTERTAKKEVQVDTAQLQSSIRPEVNLGGMSYTVKPHADHAIFAHEGRRPGKMPPVSAVESWSKRKGLDPFMVARSIGRKGTKGKKFMDIAYRKQKPTFNRESKVLLNDIVRLI